MGYKIVSIKAAVMLLKTGDELTSPAIYRSSLITIFYRKAIFERCFEPGLLRTWPRFQLYLGRLELRSVSR